MHLKNKDYAVIGGGVVLSFAAAFAAEAGIISSGLASTITGLLPQLTLLVILAGVGFVYLSRDLLGGDVSRNLEVIATGFLIYALVWWPHKIWWHGSGFGGEMPAWFGISSGAWQTFFHLLTATTIAIAGYGFYLFWKMSRE